MAVLIEFSELRKRGVLLGRRQIDRLEAEGKFPKRVPVGENRVAWVASEIDEHVRKKIAGRPTGMGLGSRPSRAKGRGQQGRAPSSKAESA